MHHQVHTIGDSEFSWMLASLRWIPIHCTEIYVTFYRKGKIPRPMHESIQTTMFIDIEWIQRPTKETKKRSYIS